MHSAPIPPESEKPLRRETIFEPVWERVKQGILAPIINDEHVSDKDWQGCIQDIYYELIMCDHLDRLFDSLLEFIKASVDKVHSILRDASLGDADKPIEESRLVRDYSRAWARFSRAMHYFSLLFHQVDNNLWSITGEASSKLPIHKMGFALWKEGCVRPLEKELVCQALRIVNYDRQGAAADNAPPHELMKECGEFANSLIRLNSDDSVDEANKRATTKRPHFKRDGSGTIQRQLQFYEEVFETRLLEESRHYYRLVCEESAHGGEEGSTDYVRAVSQVVVEERMRTRRHFHATTEPKILRFCEEEFIVKHLDRFTQALNFYLDEEREEDLERLYSTVAGCKEALDSVAREFGRRVGNAGVEAVTPILKTTPADPNRFIDVVLAQHSKSHALLRDAFHDDPRVGAEVDKALGRMVNYSEAEQTPKAAELLVRCLDVMLREEKKRRSAVSSSSADVEAQLARVLVVYRYVQDKDLFLKLYWKRAATRLLSNPSGVSNDLEKTVVYELKSVTGYESTIRLAGMLQDLETSSTLTERHRGRPTSTTDHESTATLPEVNVRVLKTVNWPLVRCTQCTLPPQVLESYQRYEEFYRGLHNGRVLRYDSIWGTAELKATFRGSSEDGTTATTKTLIVPTALMAILAEFNHRHRATFSELLEATRIPERELRRHLQAVGMPDKPKQKILNRQSQSGAEIASDDVFAINEHFTSEQSRVRIQVGPALTQHQSSQQAADESRETREELEESRRYETEAAIVRVMKSRQVMAHNTLIAEVTAQLANRFKPDPSRIKACIESLITREYLRRGDVDLEVWEYRYVA